MAFATRTKKAHVALLLGALLSPGCGLPERDAGPAVPDGGVVPPSGLLVRCGYRAGDHVRYLALAEPVSPGTELAQELRRLADAASSNPGNRLDEGRDERTPADAERSYQVALPAPDREGEVLHVELFEPGRLGRFRIATSDSAPRPTDEPRRELVNRLREQSFLRLQADMLPPWTPLPWHYLALATFLDTGVSLPAGLRGSIVRSSAELPSMLLEHLRTTERPRELGAALIERVDSFGEAQLEPLESSTEIAERLLALTRLAADGNEDALREITVLSLEYLGESELFDRALRVLFPRSSNPLLYERHPPTSREGREGFIREVRSQIDEATHGKETLWTLE